MNFWNTYSFFYDSLKVLLPYQELINKAVQATKIIKENKIRILDAGCGTGNFAETFFSLDSGDSILCGVDYSSEMMHRAIKKTRTYDNKINYIRTDINQSIPFRDGSFSAIISLNVLYALRDPSSVLKEFRRVLKFGGLLILAIPQKKAKVRDVFLEHFRMVLKTKGLKFCLLFIKGIIAIPSLFIVAALNLLYIKQRANRKKYHFFNAGNIRSLLRQNGFQVLDLEKAYGGTDIFIVATKCFYLKDKLDKEISCEIARTQRDLDSVHSLRYFTYCEEMRSLDPEDYPEQKEYDKYDPHSVHIIARLGDEIIGILRLIKNTPAGFLMEEEFKLPCWIERTKTVEHSRGIIKKEYRDRGIYTLMLQTAYEWQKNHGYTICIGTPRIDKLSPFLLKMGWEIIDNEREYHNVVVIPMAYKMAH